MHRVSRFVDNACSSFALRDIQRMRQQEGRDIRAAVASKTDEPQWARICLDHLVLVHDDDEEEQSIRLADCFDKHLIEIQYGSKVEHLRRLQKKTGVPFEQMCFFDNEHWNIKDVSRSLPAVKCFYTPNGMTRQAWDEAKSKFGLC